MDGITIVAEHFCRVVEFEELIIIGILYTLICIVGLLFYWFSYKYSNTRHIDKKILIACSAFIIILNVFTWVIQINKYNTTHMEYTVIVDNSVSLNDFYAKYEIVSVNGNEFRVIEK